MKKFGFSNGIVTAMLSSKSLGSRQNQIYVLFKIFSADACMDQ